MEFNPNELILERITSVDEYNIETKEAGNTYSQIENPSLKTSAEGTTVVDAIGAEICTFYKAQTGTFEFTNSLHSLDLMASQFGSTKEVGSDTNKIIVPVREIISIGDAGKVELKYTPVGVQGAEITKIKLFKDSDSFGTTFEVSPTAGEGKFTIDAETKTIMLPVGTTGQVFVKYDRESSTAVKITKYTDSVPKVVGLIINAIFRKKCNHNIVYTGVIIVPRAQIDISSVELNMTSDGKHSATYKLQRPYCDNESKLFEIIVTED